MTTKDIIHETTSALTANKVRTSLTMLGIIIGISSVIVMVSIGQGAQGSIQSSIQALGSNLLVISPGAQRTPGYQVSSGRGASHTLTPDDATAIGNSVQNIAAISPEDSGRYQVTAKGTNTHTPGGIYNIENTDILNAMMTSVERVTPLQSVDKDIALS